MNSKEILQDAKSLLDGTESKDSDTFKNYSDLRNAAESAKILKEIKNAKWTRWLSIASFIAAFATLLGVVLSNVKLMNSNYEKDLARVVAVKERDIETLAEQIASNEIINKRLIGDIKNIKAVLNSNRIKQAEDEETTIKFEASLTELENSIVNKKQQVKELSETVNAMQGKIDQQQNSGELSNKLRQARDQINQLNSDLKVIKSELENESQKLANTVNEIEILKDQAEQNKEKISNSEKLSEQFGFAAISERLTLKRGEFSIFSGYKITLTNTGNILNNIDLRIQLNENPSVTYINLDEGSFSVIKYRDVTFLVDVVKAHKNYKKEEEFGTFKLVLLNKSYRYTN